MSNGLKTVLGAALLAIMVSSTANAHHDFPKGGDTPFPPARGNGPVIYVTSQGLAYDSIVLADLPFNGPFQELKPGVGPTGLQTDFGPGDPEYVGGRWWVDANLNGYMDEDDVYFLCPLLGPGNELTM